MRLAFFATGNGSGLRAVADAVLQDELQATICLVVSNRASSGAIAWASSRGVDTLIIDPDTEESDQVCLDALNGRAIDLIVLSGYLRKVGPLVLERYSTRILNVHPSLLPKFGGKGMYGNRVHRAVLEAGEVVTGASVHLVDAAYDTGPIVAQDQIDIHETDTPESLADRVKLLEGRLLVKTLCDMEARDCLS